MDLLFYSEGVLLIFERLGQAGVDLLAMGRLVEDVAEGVDALHKTGADFVSDPLFAAEPNGAEARAPLRVMLASWP